MSLLLGVGWEARICTCLRFELAGLSCRVGCLRAIALVSVHRVNTTWFLASGSIGRSTFETGAFAFNQGGFFSLSVLNRVSFELSMLEAPTCYSGKSQIVSRKAPELDKNSAVSLLLGAVLLSF